MEYQRRRKYRGPLHGLYKRGWSKPDVTDGSGSREPVPQSMQLSHPEWQLQDVRTSGGQTQSGQPNL